MLFVFSIFQSGMRVSSSNQFSVQLFAHRAGQVNVKLEVSPSSNSPYIFREGLLLVDELQIKVRDLKRSNCAIALLFGIL